MAQDQHGKLNHLEEQLALDEFMVAPMDAVVIQLANLCVCRWLQEPLFACMHTAKRVCSCASLAADRSEIQASLCNIPSCAC